MTDFSDKFRDALKLMVDTRAWDKTTHTWWMPLSFMPHVVTLIRENRVAGENELTHAQQQVQIALASNRVAVGDVTIGNAYEVLGLHPLAPPMLVEWANYFWERELSAIGAPTTKLLQVREAYRLIRGAAARAAP